MIKIPESLQRNLKTTYGDAGAIWLSELPALVDRYLKLWSLKIVSEVEEQSFNFVLKVQSLEDGSLCILKAGPHIKGRLREAEMLRAYSAANHLHTDVLPIIQLLQFAESDGVLLLSAVEPGLSLEDQLLKGQISEDDATQKSAQLMKKIKGVSILETRHEKITSIQVWGLGFEKFLRENCRGALFSRPLIEKADEIFKYLHRTSAEQMLLHGDLHHGNILLDRAQNFIVIDPKGVYGDPAFEAGAFLRNPIQFLLQQPDLEDCLNQRIAIFANTLGVDRQRIWGWAFSQAVLAAIWTVEDKAIDYQKWIQVAESFEKIENKN